MNTNIKSYLNMKASLTELNSIQYEDTVPSCFKIKKIQAMENEYTALI